MRIMFHERTQKDHAAIAGRASILVEDPDLDGLVIDDVVIWYPKEDSGRPGVTFPSREFTGRDGTKKRFEVIRARDEDSIHRIKNHIAELAVKWLSRGNEPKRLEKAQESRGESGFSRYKDFAKEPRREDSNTPF